MNQNPITITEADQAVQNILGGELLFAEKRRDGQIAVAWKRHEFGRIEYGTHLAYLSPISERPELQIGHYMLEGQEAAIEDARSRL